MTNSPGDGAAAGSVSTAGRFENSVIGSSFAICHLPLVLGTFRLFPKETEMANCQWRMAIEIPNSNDQFA
jgi:hypothetical protein